MNRIIQYTAVCLLFSLNCLSQLKVENNGSVLIGLSPTELTKKGDLNIVQKDKKTEAIIHSLSPNKAIFWAVNSLDDFGFGIDENGYGHIFRNLVYPYEIMTFDSIGNLGVGLKPSYRLDVNGTLRINSTIYISNDRNKRNLTPIISQSDNLLKINCFTYNIDDHSLPKSTNKPVEEKGPALGNNEKLNIKDSERIQYGFMTNEVKEIFPDLVYEDKEGNTSIDYISFIPIIIETMKQQQATIEKLKQEIQELNKKTAP